MDSATVPVVTGPLRVEVVPAPVVDSGSRLRDGPDGNRAH